MIYTNLHFFLSSKHFREDLKWFLRSKHCKKPGMAARFLVL